MAPCAGPRRSPRGAPTPASAPRRTPGPPAALPRSARCPARSPPHRAGRSGPPSPGRSRSESLRCRRCTCRGRSTHCRTGAPGAGPRTGRRLPHGFRSCHRGASLLPVPTAAQIPQGGGAAGTAARSLESTHRSTWTRRPAVERRGLVRRCRHMCVYGAPPESGPGGVGQPLRGQEREGLPNRGHPCFSFTSCWCSCTLTKVSSSLPQVGISAAHPMSNTPPPPAAGPRCLDCLLREQPLQCKGPKSPRPAALLLLDRHFPPLLWTSPALLFP